MDVARALSFQNPGARVNCLCWFILSRLLATSKKPPQDDYAIPNIFNLFLCHIGAKLGEIGHGIKKLSKLYIFVYFCRHY
jgi:hypothetical protein